MSRIGKLPVHIPQGVKAQVNGPVVSVEGPRGKLDYKTVRGIQVKVENSEICVSLPKNFNPRDKATKAVFGSTRAHLNNMVIGVTKGWKRSLELSGVGFQAVVKGSTIVVSAGYSHEVVVPVPKEVKVAITKNVIDLDSNDRSMLGHLASKLRSVRKPEPYLGKGIKYSEEKVRRKAGKTGKK